VAEALRDIQTEQKIMLKLVSAGSTDLETALLITKARLDSSDEADMDGVIEQLKEEKQHLFSGRSSDVSRAKKTAGPKDRVLNNQAVLEKAANKAAASGSRPDLQEYLRLRRSFL